MVTIKLTDKEAEHVFMNADGWMDAGACKDGLELEEMAALKKMTDQIRAQLSGKKKNQRQVKGEA
ncbi:hypothetical protein [Serratia marcescens]|uniref:hypothetical protein n=1 Tax=Serratia marcescens TaxID=615 RepID=UPI000A10CF10|nr:hypothetical protein [Serratia marcescens]UJA52766.1 hypothetical protein L1F17_17445 [Serratia marcescens]UJA52822.1 hypothetical protein L1F17_17755 [Serratia marcescens]